MSMMEFNDKAKKGNHLMLLRKKVRVPTQLFCGFLPLRSSFTRILCDSHSCQIAEEEQRESRRLEDTKQTRSLTTTALLVGSDSTPKERDRMMSVTHKGDTKSISNGTKGM